MKTLLVFVASLAVFAQTTTRTVTLNWQDTANSAGTAYNVYRATGTCTGTPAYAKIATAVPAKTYLDPAVPVGDYCYVVTATVGGKESAYSNAAAADVQPFPPTGVTVTVSVTVSVTTPQ